VSLERFIAQRIVFYNSSKGQISRPVVRIATFGIALGITVMILAISIVGGFKKEIREKLIGFNAHLQVSHYDQNFSYETTPIQVHESLCNSIKQVKNVNHVQAYITKAGILKGNGQLQGVVAKGVGCDYDWSFFSNHLKAGNTLLLGGDKPSNGILLSSALARKLEVKNGDSLTMYFIQRPPRARKFKIQGIYETGFDEFDNLYLFCDIRQLQKLNDWNMDEVSGLEVGLKDFSQLDQSTDDVYSAIGTDLNTRSIKENYPQLFDWLSLQDINAIIIITLMITVSGINMIAALLVIMLERIRMIGTLKSLGAEDQSIRKIFLWASALIIGRGILLGNIAGLLLVSIQHVYHLVPLDEASYYIPFVPTELDLLKILALNCGTLMICLIMMILPAWWIGKVRPAVSVRFN
jgi:lipoprotein-releasing system permease protein